MTSGTAAAAATRLPGSFRDPAGYLFERDGVLYRAVDASFADELRALTESGLYAALVGEGLLVAHDEVDPDLAPDPAHAVLRPERLPFISYPYEWCPGQRRDAALLTLRVQELALAHGMTLRDASAYNIAFRHGRPLLIDTLSFARLVEGEPWVPYGQFCRHFLAPLALETMVDMRLASLLATAVDGVPLDLASRLLPASTRLRPGLLTHVHAHARSARGDRPTGAGAVRRARFSRRALEGLVASLRGAVERLTWQPDGTTWSGYYAAAGHYSDAGMRAKLDAVAAFADAVGPQRVLDLGANTGRFSRLAADRGAHVVAADVDHGAVEAAWRELRRPSSGDEDSRVGAGDILPLRYDLANPSAAIGWANAERQTLAERGRFNLVLALALVHHLAIGNNVPLPRVADLLARLGDHVVVEWVPKDDPKVEAMLATREDVFAGYTGAGFESAFAARFDLLERRPVPDSGREIHLMRTRR